MGILPGGPPSRAGPPRRREAQRREARLKQEFAALYRGVPAGVWAPVADVLDGVTACRLLTGRHSGDFMRGRPLDERHFEFRGGRRGRAESHTRVTDA